MNSTLEEIKRILKNEKSNEFSKWNLNYLEIQKDRYLSDIEYLKSLTKVKDVLEIGGAPFHMTKLLKDSFDNVTSLDLDPSRFQEFIHYFDLDVRKCDLELDSLPVENKSYDLIVFCEVFEHLRINPIETLSKISSKLKPDGVLYLTTPNFYRIGNITNLIRGRGFVNAFQEFNKLNTLGHMGHVREYTKGEILDFLTNEKLSLVDFKYKNSKTPSMFLFRALQYVFPQTKSHMRFTSKPK